MHSNTQRLSDQVIGGRAGPGVTLCACRCVYAHTWKDDHVSNWKTRHQQWMTIQVEYRKGNLEIRGQPFPASAGKIVSICNKGQGFIMMEFSLYDTFFLPVPSISSVYVGTSSIPIPLILALQPANLTLPPVSSYPPLQLLITLKTPYRPI